MLSATLPCEFCGSSIALENLDAHQRQCLEESQEFQIPVLVEGDDTYIHTYTLFILEIYRVAVQLISSRK